MMDDMMTSSSPHAVGDIGNAAEGSSTVTSPASLFISFFLF